MSQRVMIAMAIACGPKLLIADEPTTALDVTIQAQILDLLQRLQKELSMAVVLISHNLGVVSDLAQRVAVMYAGQVVEVQSAAALTGDHSAHEDGTGRIQIHGAISPDGDKSQKYRKGLC
jgi:dipeptide transport system ATP-binding protein